MFLVIIKEQTVYDTVPLNQPVLVIMPPGF